MLEEARKLLLAAVGVAATTYDKSVDIIEQLVEKGKLTVEEGKELSEELKRDVKVTADNIKNKASEKIEDIKPVTKEELKQMLSEFNFATKEELLALNTKIIELEERLTE